MNRRALFFALLALVASLFVVFMMASSAISQPATVQQMGKYQDKPEFGVIHLRTKLGSIKAIDGEGRLEISFTGTLLITNLEGKSTFSGDIREEYNKHGRACYTGKGTAVIEGKWRGIQFFGSDMNCTWFGRGFIRVTGEFDENLQTGDYWYENPSEKRAFPNANVKSDVVPDPRRPVKSDIVPKPRKHKD